MSCGIYKITNQINGHSYIGQSIFIEDRWRQEKGRAFKEDSSEYDKTLSKAFRKYGLENFIFEILEECEPSELDEKEIYYISFYDTYFNGYNETTGGQGSPNSSIKISKEQILEIYNLLLNSDISQNDIAKKYGVGYDVISNINQGKSRRLDGYNFPLRKYKKEYFCIDCGIEVSEPGVLRCNKCRGIIQRKVERPSKEILFKLLSENEGNFTKIGQQFNVTDNTIRKWCKAYELPYHSKDYIIEGQTITKYNSKTTRNSKTVKQLDKITLKELNRFVSIAEAGKYIKEQNKLSTLSKNIASKIWAVCKGTQNTAYGYVWKFIE